MLARGRLDLALANDFVGYALAANYAPIVVPAELPTGIDEFHIAISKNSNASDLIPEINRVIAELKQEGFLDDIIKKP
jgi:ABC-type amino acid transport substrate-binding protein